MNLFPTECRVKAEAFLRSCNVRGWKLAVAESCTGGLLSACFTEIPGSSAVFTHGFITYANEAKQQMLGVSADALERDGAVSESVAIAMADGARRVAQSTLSVAITGVAGPGGGSAHKPVGLVYIASACDGFSTLCERRVFSGDRDQVRMQSVVAALDMLQRQLCR